MRLSKILLLQPLQHISTLEEAYYKQKSKIHLLTVGDQNNKYFHRVAQARASQNAIRMIKKVDGETIKKVEDIKKEADD